jgi:hypothetical protein
MGFVNVAYIRRFWYNPATINTNRIGNSLFREYERCALRQAQGITSYVNQQRERCDHQEVPDSQG